jgi:hypothetical protein
MNRASGRSSGFAQQGGCSGFPFPGALDAGRKKEARILRSYHYYSSFPRKRESRGLQGCGRGPPVQARGQALDPRFQARACTHLAGPVRNPSPPFRGEREGPTPHGVRAERGSRPSSWWRFGTVGRGALTQWRRWKVVCSRCGCGQRSTAWRIVQRAQRRYQALRLTAHRCAAAGLDSGTAPAVLASMPSTPQWIA